MSTTRKPALATLSIQSDRQYSALRTCAQDCVDKKGNNKDIEGELDCGDSKILDSCFCMRELRSRATQYLSSCIITRCGYLSQDFTSAVKVYDDYCSYTALPTTTTITVITTTESHTSQIASATNTETSPKITDLRISDNSTSGFESPTVRGSLISAGAIAGIVIGGIVTLVAGALVMMWMHSRLHRAKHSQRQAVDEQSDKHPDQFRQPAGVFELVTENRSHESMATPTGPYFEVYGSTPGEFDAYSERKLIELSVGKERECS